MQTLLNDKISAQEVLATGISFKPLINLLYLSLFFQLRSRTLLSLILSMPFDCIAVSSSLEINLNFCYLQADTTRLFEKLFYLYNLNYNLYYITLVTSMFLILIGIRYHKINSIHKINFIKYIDDKIITFRNIHTIVSKVITVCRVVQLKSLSFFNIRKGVLGRSFIQCFWYQKL